jgi:hypothetical protein
MSRRIASICVVSTVAAFAMGFVAGERARRTGECKESVQSAAANSPGPSTNAVQSLEPLPKLPAGRTFPLRDAAELGIEEALSEPAEINYVDVELGVVVDDLMERYRVPVVLDRLALTADGKGSESIIRKSLSGTSLRNLLGHILEEQGLTFIVKNGALVITTKTAAESTRTVRVYQLHDLIFDPALHRTINLPVPRVGVCDAWRCTDRTETAASSSFDPLIELVTSCVEPETWREAGGTQGEIKPFVGPGVVGIVVTQTNDVHEQIDALLDTLRTAREPALLELQRLRSLPQAAVD